MLNKEERKEKALKHAQYTQSKFEQETKETVKNTIVYDNEKIALNKNATFKNPEVIVSDLTTETAVKIYGDNCCVLNFASFINPGGGYLKGSMAQEEALCNNSNLYDVLFEFEGDYDNNFINKKRLNYSLYCNWIIYSPNICFIFNENTYKEEVIKANVITCAAPNAKRYFKYYNSDEEIYKKTLFERCKYILDVAEKNNNKVLILGAFGCGVFGNSPKDVASVFKKLLYNKEYSFEKVIFAIPKDKNDNLKVFKEIFTD